MAGSETFPSGLPSEVIRFARSQRIQKDSLDLAMCNNIIHQYSECHLSIQKHKLVAIYRLARIAQTQIKSTYLAEMWTHDLESQLLWQSGGLGRRYSTYTAPTWSWASIDRLIFVVTAPRLTHLTHLIWNQIAVDNFWITTASSDPFGEVTAGRLRLKCK